MTNIFEVPRPPIPKKAEQSSVQKPGMPEQALLVDFNMNPSPPGAPDLSNRNLVREYIYKLLEE